MARPSFRDKLRDNDKAARGYEAMYGDLRIAKGAPEHPMNNVPDAVRRGPVKNAAAREDLEAGVSDEVEAMLHEHPMVAFVIRQNAGQTTFRDDHGTDHHVAFSRFVKKTSKKRMRVPDYWGMLITGKLLVIETKKRSWHMTLSDTRAQEQWNFMEGVIANGGRAGFATNVEEAKTIVEGK